MSDEKYKGVQVQGLNLPPQIAEILLGGDKTKSYHLVTWLSKVYPDESDLATVVLVRCSTYVMAQDSGEAYSLFINNVPDSLPVLYLLSIAPTEIEETQLLTIIRGPRAVN